MAPTSHWLATMGGQCTSDKAARHMVGKSCLNCDMPYICRLCLASKALFGWGPERISPP